MLRLTVIDRNNDLEETEPGGIYISVSAGVIGGVSVYSLL